MLASITVESNERGEKRVGILEHAWDRFNDWVTCTAGTQKHALDYLVIVIGGNERDGSHFFRTGGATKEIQESCTHGLESRLTESEHAAQPGMVLCVEPVIAGMDGPECGAGIFIVEDKLLVTEDGCENLTDSLSKEMWVQAL